MNVSVGSCCPELAQAHSSVALAWHKARGSTPFGVTAFTRLTWKTCNAFAVGRCVLQRCMWPCLPSVSDELYNFDEVRDLHATRYAPMNCKLTWLVLGKDPAACSCRAEQFIAR